VQTKFHILPGTKELAKNLLVDAKAIVLQVHGTPDSVLAAAMLQTLTLLAIHEKPPFS
jgi:hypothetical protein